MIRRSRLLPRALWLAARAVAPVSATAAGRLTSWLWFVPWQHDVGATDLTAGTRRHRLVAAGHEVDVYEAGSGPSVLLVHGWADRAASLRPLADALLLAGWRVVAVDLPAHGDTPGVRTDAVVQAGVLSELVGRFGVRAIVAHSLGGTATALALRGDDLGVARVVLLSPAVRLETAIATFLREVALPASVGHALRARIERHFGSGVWADIAVDRNLAGSHLPGLVIHDEEDRRAPVDEARALVGAWPGGRLHTTSGLGHRRLLADPDVIARVVADLDAALERSVAS